MSLNFVSQDQNNTKKKNGKDKYAYVCRYSSLMIHTNNTSVTIERECLRVVLWQRCRTCRNVCEQTHTTHTHYEHEYCRRLASAHVTDAVNNRFGHGEIVHTYTVTATHIPNIDRCRGTYAGAAALRPRI